MELLWQIVFIILGVLVLALLVFKMYLEIIKGKCTSKADLTGKIAIVTGANTGIGFWTALDFARRNAKVIVACRDEAKGQEAVKKIAAATGSDNVHMRKLDLSSMKSVREFAENFLSEESRLDILVNNAGVAGLPLQMTEEGFEMIMATNHFGPFLLTNLLLDLLQKSQPSRVVNVSSMAHTWCTSLDCDNLRAEKSFGIRKFYSISKLANVLFTRELARKTEGKGVAVYCAHPGLVATEVWRHLPFIGTCIVALVKILFMKTPEEGAQTSIFCAVSEEVDGISGHYYLDCREGEDQASELSRDQGLASKLWEVSERLTGLAY